MLNNLSYVAQSRFAVLSTLKALYLSYETIIRPHFSSLTAEALNHKSSKSCLFLNIESVSVIVGVKGGG